ncbi:MAG: type II toxin-antitoxin system HicA family toxin [Pirellulales bacterium]|nr:type II toxin-antitoxin system HicA family toxin [Pirellulales bacterium]
MSKLPTITGVEALAAFQKLGYVEVRVKRSHHVMKREGSEFLLSIPVHRRKNLKRGTLRALLRTAEITVDEFCDLLQ